MSRVHLPFALAAMLIVVPTASADVIITNLPGNDGAGTSTAAVPTKAMGFTMGDDAYALDSAELRLQTSASFPQVSLTLFDDDMGSPGSPVATFTTPSLSANTIATYTFLPDSPFTLEANTTYWLVLAKTGGTPNLRWLASNPGVAPTGDGADHFGTTPGSILNSYQINGTLQEVVPEPTSLALFGFGVCGLIGCRWRRKPIVA